MLMMLTGHESDMHQEHYSDLHIDQNRVQFYAIG